MPAAVQFTDVSAHTIQIETNIFQIPANASAPLPQSALPERVWMVPYRRNPFFTGREQLLSALYEDYTTNQAAVLTQGQAIIGLGGIGKTQVVVEYAYRHQEDYRWVLWVNATTPTTLTTDLAVIADRLQLPERQPKDQGKIVAAVLQWLATNKGWLLIVDNADELDQVWPRLPTGSAGHVLLTTRDQAVGELRRFPVEQMDREEGTLLLLRRAGVLTPETALEQAPMGDRQVAEQIVTAMDGLPLALDQVGAYIEETGCGLKAYWNRYQQQRMVLLDKRGRSGRAHPASVWITLFLSFEQVKQRSAVADALLSVCAFLAPDAIPEEIIMLGASHLGAQLQVIRKDHLQLDEAIGVLGGLYDYPQLDEAISVLRAYSLVRRDREEHTLSVHRLVQAVRKDSLKNKTQHQWAARIVKAVYAAFDPINFDDDEIENFDLGLDEALLPHVHVCAELIERWGLTFPEATQLLDNASLYLLYWRRYPEMLPLAERALAIREQVLGPVHPDTLQNLDWLASLYQQAGKYEQAEPLYQRALAIREQQLGPEDPGTATSLDNLASLYRAQGKYEQAEPLYQRALAIREQVLGPVHPDTLQNLDSLASLYQQQGKYEQAEPLYQRALAIREQIQDQDPFFAGPQ